LVSPAGVELHSHSAYSFGDGASLPSEMARAAAELGYSSLALTDHDGVWGSMEFAHACKEPGTGIHAIHGAEMTLEGGHHVTLLVESAAGWRNLCRLVTEAHARTRDGPGRTPLPPFLPIESLERRSEGLVCLSGCARSGAVAGRWEGSDVTGAEDMARRLLRAFGREHFRIELQRPMWRRDRARNAWLAELAERLGVPAVATGDAHAHAASRAQLQDALVSARLGVTLDESEGERRGNRAFVLVSPEQMAARFAEHPRALHEASLLAEQLTFDLTSDLGYTYPGSEDEDADRKLSELCWAKLADRYEGTPELAAARRSLEEELGLIRQLHLAGFFLLHHEMLELAREVALEVRGPDSARSLLPPGRGRGSSVSSIVCHLTGLSHIDPVKNKLFLGRFLNEDLKDVPDIDIDFPRDIREVLIPRVHERYGQERSALVAAMATYRSKGAIRDLGKALGLPAGEIERVTRLADSYGGGEEIEREIAAAVGPERAASPRWKALAELSRELVGLPRHVSQHPGGMVISTGQLIDICPVQPAAMEGRQMVQWDKDSCADARFLKIDLLGLGMLSAVERCVDQIAKTRNERIDLSRIPFDDPPVWEAIQKAETTGVFQIESRAQMQMLPRTLPANLDDLTVQVALVRPGPIQGGAVHPYIERRKARRADPSYEIPYEHPSLEEPLKDTLGAIVFQDQVIEVSMAMANFTPGEAEGLRRAMSRRRSGAEMEKHHVRFIEGAVANGVEPAIAERVFAQIQGFSGFGFPKSHSAAFGLLAYQSTWLRVHYGPEFLCGLLNEQPMGFYPPDALIHEAQRRGIEIRGPDVNRSEAECSVETRADEELADPSGPAVRVGLGYIATLPEADVQAVVEERERGGPYSDLTDLAARSGAGPAALEKLAWSGACDRLEPASPARRAPLWSAGVAAAARREPEGTQLALPLGGTEPPAESDGRPLLPELEPWELVTADYRSTSVSIGKHPMELLRPQFGDSVLASRQLESVPHGSRIETAGLVVARQRPATAKGVVFMLLEDEWGVMNLILPPPVAQRDRIALRTAGSVRAWGKLERREGVTNVVVDRLEALKREEVVAARPRSTEPAQGREVGELGERRARAAAELAAALPAPHSWGRRG
jgi:error-prone DNA polymerase